RAIIGKRLQPSSRIGIKSRSRGNPAPPAVRGRYAGDQGGLASEFGCHGGTRAFRQGRVFPDTTIGAAHTPFPLGLEAERGRVLTPIRQKPGRARQWGGVRILAGRTPDLG